MLNAANDAAKEHRCYFQRAGWGRGGGDEVVTEDEKYEC